MRLAEQNQSFRGLGIAESERLAVWVVHLALQKPGAACAAVAAFAAVGQIDSGIEGRIEHRPVRGGTETTTGCG